MTVIAWDGRTLAADKLACFGSLRSTVTKLRRINGWIVGGSGDAAAVAEHMAWFQDGGHPEKFPASLREKDCPSMLLSVHPHGQVLKWENCPHPIELQCNRTAIGSGRDYAMAAMHLGCDARRAVEVASELDVSCGMGIDTLTFEE
jgi:ATP-dependent protease HslVU (ClpYQ) peptidase subunit